MGVTEHLHRRGGFAHRAALIALTSRRQVDRAISAGDVVQLSRGRCALPTADRAVSRAQEVRGVVSHLSAASWWGWELAVQPFEPQVTVPKHRRLPGSRAGIHFVDLHPEDVHDGLVTGRERTLVNCLRTLPEAQGLAVADSALRHGHFAPGALILLSASVGGPGAPAVRRVLRAARGEAANPFESVLRARAIGVGLDVEPQMPVRHGSEWVVPDLVDRTRRLVLEATRSRGTETALLCVATASATTGSSVTVGPCSGSPTRT